MAIEQAIDGCEEELEILVMMRAEACAITLFQSDQGTMSTV